MSSLLLVAVLNLGILVAIGVGLLRGQSPRQVAASHDSRISELEAWQRKAAPAVKAFDEFFDGRRTLEGQIEELSRDVHAALRVANDAALRVSQTEDALVGRINSLEGSIDRLTETVKAVQGALAKAAKS